MWRGQSEFEAIIDYEWGEVQLAAAVLLNALRTSVTTWE